MGVVTGAFVLTCVLVVVAPGPSLAVIIDQTLRGGRSAGLVTVAGNVSGQVGWALASVLGLTALVRTSEIAFVVLKVAGAVYLCWLGVQSLRRARRNYVAPSAAATPGPAEPVRVGGTGRRRGLASSYRAGLLTNATNPKAAALYLALFPQFLPADGNALLDTATLAGTQMLISAVWYSLMVLVVGTARLLLARPRVRAVIDGLTGAVLVGLGIRMITMSRAAV
ncbi:LysE family translocator [Goodfellowiella coeruleoviolacea]|uniref:Threonine/homoserine/homoserine lactone efflux protein n=1 Tax=Goodfellowiella coeruleoviolacea TaxID=334858 RepID=A0AAE3GDT1_9PSEU|nr:LysE family translocator [Goodfellowiella coeruleoviolacea]MCP2166285.1 Threonine/homoserine/homoserine lactone efflux protein [Goodfellowiella coeruleoviolacea]